MSARLLDQEKKALSHALEGVEGDIFIYGSRSDPGKKGGDIDVLIMSRVSSPYRLAQDIAVRFQMECDEKIDVMVVNPDHIPEEQRLFLDCVRRKAVPLK